MHVNCTKYDFCECGHARKVHRQGLKCEVCQYAAYLLVEIKSELGIRPDNSVASAGRACREFKLAKDQNDTYQTTSYRCT